MCIVCNFTYFIKVYCVDDFCVEYMMNTVEMMQERLECELDMMNHNENN